MFRRIRNRQTKISSRAEDRIRKWFWIVWYNTCVYYIWINYLKNMQAKNNQEILILNRRRSYVGYIPFGKSLATTAHNIDLRHRSFELSYTNFGWSSYLRPSVFLHRHVIVDENDRIIQHGIIILLQSLIESQT